MFVGWVNPRRFPDDVMLQSTQNSTRATHLMKIYPGPSREEKLRLSQWKVAGQSQNGNIWR